MLFFSHSSCSVQDPVRDLKMLLEWWPFVRVRNENKSWAGSLLVIVRKLQKTRLSRCAAGLFVGLRVDASISLRTAVRSGRREMRLERKGALNNPEDFGSDLLEIYHTFESISL